MRITIITLAAFYLLGCTFKEMAIDVPTATSISSISLSSGDHKETVIRDREKIKNIVNFICMNNGRWRDVSGEYPTPQSTVAFLGAGNDVRFILWFGPGWVGGASYVHGLHGAKIWNLKPSARKELMMKIGLNE